MTAPMPKARRPKPASARTTIAVQGARAHNLKNVSVEIPRDRLVVVTGLSGSGKSSLAFDTIYGEDLELVFTEIRKKGVRRLIVDGKPVDLSDKVELDDSSVTHMDALVDRFLVGRQHEKAIKAGIAATLLVGDGLLQVHLPKANRPFYESFSKTHHFVYGDIGPDYFLFNNPESACRTCGGPRV